MKKYNYIIVSLLACLLTTSCNDYFDQVPDDRLSLKEIFTTRDGALRYPHSYRMNLTNVRYMRPVCTVLPALGQVPVTRQSGQMTIREN